MLVMQGSSDRCHIAVSVCYGVTLEYDFVGYHSYRVVLQSVYSVEWTDADSAVGNQ